MHRKVVRFLVAASLLVLLALLGTAEVSAQTESCLANELGINQVSHGMNIFVSNVTPVKVADKNLKRCQLLLINQGGGDVSCMSSWQGAPSPAVGVIIPSGQQLAQQTSGRGEWWCMAITATASTVLVLEELPNVP
jgi:hypothetical protein